MSLGYYFIRYPIIQRPASSALVDIRHKILHLNLLNEAPYYNVFLVPG